MYNKKKSYEISVYLLSHLTFIRPVYRALFSKQRTYAAFDVEQLSYILKKLKPDAPILDPMSGYGVLANVCRELGYSTCSVELNPPSYLWQILMDVSRKDILLEGIHCLRSVCDKLREDRKTQLGVCRIFVRMY